MLKLKEKPVDILLIEDNKGDVLLTTEAFNESRIVHNMHVAENGEQALDMLYNKAPYERMSTPHLILLDLNLPKISGKEVLDTIKSDHKLRNIPVIILTGSKAEKDILESYNLHANCYIVKPSNLDELSEIVDSIEKFWFSVCALPVSN